MKVFNYIVVFILGITTTLLFLILIPKLASTNINVQNEDVIFGKIFFTSPISIDKGTLNLEATATVEDVLSGKTFFANTSQIQIGTAKPSIDYSLQQYNKFDDYRGPAGSKSTDEDYQGDEVEWKNSSTNVWQDQRTYVYWTNSQGQFSNEFSSNCKFFISSPRGSYTGNDPSCGKAINYCATMNLDANNDGKVEDTWYLPTQKELMQAYIDGAINQTNQNFFTTDMVWTSTELSFKPTNAWGGSLATGGVYAADNLKNIPFTVHCILKK